MLKTRLQALIVAVFLPFLRHAPAADGQSAPYHATDRGIKLHIGGADVELGMATPTAFRFSVAYQGKQPAVASTFLAPGAKGDATNWSVVHRDALVGIASVSGRLLIDPQNGRWTLEDAQGNALIPESELGKIGTVALPDKTQVSGIEQPLASKSGAPPAVYGGGDGTAGLQQTKVRTRVGNGTSVVPYYWSPSGYAILAVTGNDDEPAFWSEDQSAVIWSFPGLSADLYLMPAATLAAASAA